MTETSRPAPIGHKTGPPGYPPMAFNALMMKRTVPAPSYMFRMGHRLRYRVDYCWAVQAHGQKPLNEYLEGSAEILFEGISSQKGLAIRGMVDSASNARASAKAPPLAAGSQAQILLSHRGKTMGMKWKGMAFAFRAPFWLCFPPDGLPESRQWTEQVDLALPLIEQMTFPVDFTMLSGLRDNPCHVRLVHRKSDSEATVQIDGEVRFSAPDGTALETSLSVVLQGRSTVNASIKATLLR